MLPIFAVSKHAMSSEGEIINYFSTHFETRNIYADNQLPICHSKSHLKIRETDKMTHIWKTSSNAQFQSLQQFLIRNQPFTFRSACSAASSSIMPASSISTSDLTAACFFRSADFERYFVSS